MPTTQVSGLQLSPRIASMVGSDVRCAVLARKEVVGYVLGGHLALRHVRIAQSLGESIEVNWVRLADAKTESTWTGDGRVEVKVTIVPRIDTFFDVRDVEHDGHETGSFSFVASYLWSSFDFTGGVYGRRNIEYAHVTVRFDVSAEGEANCTFLSSTDVA